MAGVEVTITGMLYDKLNRTTQNVVLIGEATLTGVGIGGGPIMPPSGGGLPERPVDPGYGIPLPPDYKPPGIWPSPGPLPHPEHPIVLPPEQVPPDLRPPEPPSPGDPTTIVPPPAGSQGWPVQPIAVPAYLVINYPGVGPVYVAPPLTAQPKPA